MNNKSHNTEDHTPQQTHKGTEMWGRRERTANHCKPECGTALQCTADPLPPPRCPAHLSISSVKYAFSGENDSCWMMLRCSSSSAWISSEPLRTYVLVSLYSSMCIVTACGAATSGGVRGPVAAPHHPLPRPPAAPVQLPPFPAQVRYCRLPPSVCPRLSESPPEFMVTNVPAHEAAGLDPPPPPPVRRRVVCWSKEASTRHHKSVVP